MKITKVVEVKVEIGLEEARDAIFLHAGAFDRLSIIMCLLKSMTEADFTHLESGLPYELVNAVETARNTMAEKGFIS